jgi:hypothetical protein
MSRLARLQLIAPVALFAATRPRAPQASLIDLAPDAVPNLYLVTILFGASLLSCAVSHFVYLHSIK